MAKPDKSHANIAKEIAKKYGSVIDLNKSPSVILEIIRNYKYLFGADDPPGTISISSIAVAGPGINGTGTGGTGSGTGSGTSGTGSGTGSGVDGTGGVGAGTAAMSTIAVAGPKQINDGDIYMSNAAVMKAILAMHRDVKAIAAALTAKAPAAKAPAAKAPAAKAPAAKKR